jgi:hypothetical protein
LIHPLQKRYHHYYYQPQGVGPFWPVQTLPPNLFLGLSTSRLLSSSNSAPSS